MFRRHLACKEIVIQGQLAKKFLLGWTSTENITWGHTRTASSPQPDITRLMCQHFTFLAKCIKWLNMYSYYSLVISYMKISFVLFWDKLLLELWSRFNFNPRQYIVEPYWFHLATMYRSSISKFLCHVLIQNCWRFRLQAGGDIKVVVAHEPILVH